MFGRRSPAADSADQTGTATAAAEVDHTDTTTAAELPKGRPTPSRREAEAQRRSAVKVPSDPKAAKKAMKQRERESRMQARAGLMAGDERYLPERDRGPAKAFMRDYIDRRRRLSEFFVFIALGILLAGFFRNPQVQNIVSMVWFAIAALVILEVSWTLIQLNRELKAKWPDKADRKSCLFHAVMRMLQIRKMRIPPPRVRPGGEPIPPPRSNA